MKNNCPVFIVAPVRSGSTLLSLMLNSHSNITNPGECDFMFDMISDSGRLPSCVEYHEWLLINRIFQSKKLNVDTDISYMDLMSSFTEQFHNKGSVLTMNVHRHFQRIPTIYPTARYIHLLRDPRDVARSCIGMGWVGNVYYGVDIWEDAEKSWETLKLKLKKNDYLEIKYEDLLDDIKGVLTQICIFLGVEYSECMMDYASHSTYDLPDKKLRYQWKSKLNEKDLSLVEGKVSKMLLERGYKLSGFPVIKPGIFEKITLMIGNKKYRAKYHINKYGAFLYLENFIANKLGLVERIKSCRQKINAIDNKGLK